VSLACGLRTSPTSGARLWASRKRRVRVYSVEPDSFADEILGLLAGDVLTSINIRPSIPSTM